MGHARHRPHALPEGASATRVRLADSYEQCWRDYVFQLVLPFLRLLVMAPGLARDRRKRIGMFAPTLTPAAQKLTEMYKQLNSRLAQALIDHQWWERVLELPITAAWCCSPCC